MWIRAWNALARSTLPAKCLRPYKAMVLLIYAAKRVKAMSGALLKLENKIKLGYALTHGKNMLARREDIAWEQYYVWELIDLLRGSGWGCTVINKRAKKNVDYPEFFDPQATPPSDLMWFLKDGSGGISRVYLLCLAKSAAGSLPVHLPVLHCQCDA